MRSGTLLYALPPAVVAAALAFRLLAGSGEGASVEAPPVPVRVLRPAYGELVRSVGINGHVESDRTVTVLPLVSGTLQELRASVGDTVERGQVLARIDPERYALQFRQAEAAYLSAKSTFDRVSQLYQAAATSAQNYEQAAGQYEALRSQYELARLQLGYTEVSSPLDGVVLVRHLSAGSMAAPERPLFTIADLTDLVVRCRVPEGRYGAFIAAGSDMPVLVRRSDGSSYAGRIRSISPYVSPETKNFEVVVAVEGGGMLRPGMFVTVDFQLYRRSGVYTLPYAALAAGDSLWYVEDGTARRETFKPAEFSDEAFVVEERWAGRDVVVEGAYFLREGSAAAVVP